MPFFSDGLIVNVVNMYRKNRVSVLQASRRSKPAHYRNTI
ncbi:hypothetical protein l11_08710 [Neisseria weaveri LMG 5135]|nr:hypothetical protein l11_08710 [Neisseria weaveri LMG 5135]